MHEMGCYHFSSSRACFRILQHEVLLFAAADSPFHFLAFFFPVSRCERTSFVSLAGKRGSRSAQILLPAELLIQCLVSFCSKGRDTFTFSLFPLSLSFLLIISQGLRGSDSSLLHARNNGTDNRKEREREREMTACVCVRLICTWQNLCPKSKSFSFSLSYTASDHLLCLLGRNLNDPHFFFFSSLPSPD